ncbi:hypothetical protein T265_03605 [Opisthorchis viverrini]|uniref:Uncharacterized protein n=1 Tax=Opisthorchis viverrini TaxID=6198 RepID=A0A074ZRS9_OPIVI|nr:hypothetical protein T265_03605 [Opisthorchis viverrini]KER29806.1 hypothetical protein T265_03605 [Opisthorchis viverrini]
MARSCATHAKTPSTEMSVALSASFRRAQTASWTTHELAEKRKEIMKSLGVVGVVRLPGWGPLRSNKWRLIDVSDLRAVSFFPDCLIEQLGVLEHPISITTLVLPSGGRQGATAELFYCFDTSASASLVRNM